MRNLIIFLLTVFPMFIIGQNQCNFFEFRKLEVNKTNLNTTQSEFGPSIVNDELWFSAFTPDEILKLESGKKKKIFYNLFSLKLDGDGNATGSKNVELEELSAGYHAGPVSYCAKTKELFVTINNFENPEIVNKVYRKADIRLKIIIAEEIDGVWKLKEELPFNDSTYSVGHPSVSVTGDTLFFASDKPNTGFGKSDIYMSVRKDGVWGSPINLGNKINTPEDEMFPFFFKSSILFYATNKSVNQNSNFDIQYNCLSETGFGNSVALNGINTPEDDFGLIIHQNEKIGYFVSRREGGMGDDDIYKVSFKGEFNLELIVMDKKTMQAIPNPKVKFSDNITGTIAGVLVSRPLSENSTIKASTEFEGYQNSSKNITTTGKPFGIIRDTLWVEKVEVKQTFVLNNIFYDFDKWNILPESEVELNNLINILNDNPSWNVELGSHTDARGSDAYNMRLSQKRSDSAVAYIVKNGIGKDRIVAKGYGEKQLVNHCKNGVECSDDVHRQNRRTEFKILKMDNK